MTDAQLHHIFVEVAIGRGRHGGFLRSFADAVTHADGENFELLKPAMESLVAKYPLEQYLDTFQAAS